MGNSPSSSDSDDDINVDCKDDDNLSEGEQDHDGESHPALDLIALFDPILLRTAAAKIKDDVPENIIQQYQALLVRWLEERNQRNEETVTLAQFYDVLMNKSVAREDCVNAFQQFDSEGDGTADVSTMLEALKSYNQPSVQGELRYVVRTLQACSLTPGFIDVYNEDKESIGQHGARILNFLLRNRAPSSSLPYPVLSGFNNTMHMRLSTLTNQFSKIKDSVINLQGDNILGSGEELKLITKCFHSVDVSTNKGDSHRLINGDTNSYWQSDGAARSHWIRLRVKSHVVIQQLSVGVSSSDQSYMPQTVSVMVGKTTKSHGLREIKEVRIPSHWTGDVVLLENAKIFDPVIQISIKRCHSDGCDTRIHSIKTLGYRVIKESGVSVVDASAAWYLQVLSATATASIPHAPGLRTTILQHTKDALKNMPPLSLAQTSSERPAFLSQHVLREMDTFLQDISKENDCKVHKDGLSVLLSLNLARGYVAGIIRTLILLQDYKDVEMEISDILHKMEEVKDSFWKKHGGPLSLTLAGCDGGQKEDSVGPANVLTGNWTSATAYITESGKTKVNMFFKGTDHIQVTKMKIKVDKGPKGPSKGMVFVFNLEGEFKLESQIERFADYDEWGQTEYSFCNKVRTAGIAGKPDNPVAFFTLEDDWDEIDLPLDACPIGHYILVKFLEPRQTSAGRLGIVGVKFYGFMRKGVFVEELALDKLAPIPDEGGKSGADTINLHALTFLVTLARDHGSPMKKAHHTGRSAVLDMADLTVESVWDLYKGYDNKICKNLSLQLLHALFPFLVNAKDKSPEVSSENFFNHLCQLVDNSHEKLAEDSQLSCVAKQVIVDGAAVFFPNKEARRKQLFNMMTDVNATADTPSVSLTFQSLCQFFSSIDPSGLLDLPSNVDKEFDQKPVLAVMDTLISVAYREFQKVFDTVEVTEQSSHLVQLLCSLQTSLLSWCYRQLDLEKKDGAVIVQNILVAYVELLCEKACRALESYCNLTDEEMGSLIGKLQKTFLATALCQMVLIITLITGNLASATRTKLLNLLLDLVKIIRQISTRLEQHFYQVDSNHWEKLEGGEVVLRTWEVESNHNYDNNQHITQVFSCPGASSFVVEFDARCETEKRYDYLEFTDFRGVRARYDQKVGSEKWANSVTFAGGHRLQFHFHSDSSNNEWGYKFKVTAKGCPDVPLCWMFDLQLSLSKLCGRLCGATLDSSQILPKIPSGNDTNIESEFDLFKSDLWTTLFRGGYTVGKLQRSFSGRHVAEHDASSEAAGFLWSMIEDDEGLAPAFLKKCQEHNRSQKIGGKEVDEAVIAVFASLVWHTQTLREDVCKYAREDGERSITDGLYLAHNVAEGLRANIMEQRQKQKVSAEKTGIQPTFDPVLSCQEKAIFLLKFSGLSRVSLKSESSKSKLDRRASKVYNRMVSHTGEKPFKLDNTLEKYPSFRLVLDFVRDPAWMRERVEHLLKERSLQAQAVSEVYMFVAEFIRINSGSHIFQIPIVVFLQELFHYQEKFSKHYADGLDGCGLELEARVRRAYYTLVRRMVDSVRAFNRLECPKNVVPCVDYVQVCMLHLLDVNWQPYDLPLLVDLKIPDLYLSLAKASVSMREKSVSDFDERAELEDYKKSMGWYEECKKNFFDWYEKHSKPSVSKDEKKAVQMFVARFCDLLDVEISCDGCGVTLPGRRYRCLQCQDMDLCASCYAGGVKPGGEHTDSHDIVHLMFKCDECQAFIVGTRINCGICVDFDLCLGCQNAGTFPPGHTSEHKVIKHPMVKLKLNKLGESSLLSYIHQHVWLQFSSLALAMARILYSSGKHTITLDADYVKAATQIHGQCTEIAIKCLMHVSNSENIPDDEETPDGVMSRLEEAFAVHSQERIMGLLGAMIPAENLGPLAEDVSFTFTSEEFLTLLFSIAIGDSGHETNTQHFAMGLIGQLLQRTSTDCKVADTAVKSLSSTLFDSDDDTLVTVDSSDGNQTAQFLFKFGATCLERSGLEWANSMASILQKLFNTPTWREILLQHISTSVESLKESPQLSSIFALFVVAGFPEVLSIGSQVKYTDIGTEVRYGVVLKHFPDKSQTLLVDKKSRRRRMVKDEYVETISHDMQVLDEQHISAYIRLIHDIGLKVKNSEFVSAESMWVMSLTLKALLKVITNGLSQPVERLFSPEFVQCAVYLASQGTGFSKQWLLKDLEILSLMLYTRDTDGADIQVEEGKSPQKEKNPDSQDPWNGLDDTAKLCFQTLYEHINVPIPVLRAIYDMQGQSTNALLMAVHENIEGESFTPSDEIKQLAKKWEEAASTAAELAADKVTDSGMQLVSLPSEQKRSFEEATPEPSEESQRLISTTDNDVKNDALKQRKTKSAELLKKELETQGKSCSRDFLVKVNMAMSILYSRQLLTSLLADWPASGHVITADLIGCKERSHVPFVLDLLNRSEMKETFQKVVQNVIRHCEPEGLIAISKTSCQFMEEVNLSTITKESEHNYKNNTDYEDKVHIPGAAFLSIKFDSRCCTEDACDQVVMASSSDYKLDKHVFSGPREKWVDFDLPGDTLYFKFSSDCSNNDWGYKFTVTGGRLGRFDTGYMILNGILSVNFNTKLDYLNELWTSLVYVCCKQTGQQRLKSLQLLLLILQSQFKCTGTSHMGMDLSLLKPLWQLYNKMSQDSPEAGSVLTPVVRALTELFFVAEDLALEWGVTRDYTAALQDKADIHKVVFLGLQNIAALSLVMNYENKATEGFQALKEQTDKNK